MNYKDDVILTIEQYENIAKKYSESLKKNGFKIIKVDNEKNKELINQILSLMSKIKSSLFRLGGFFNTSKIYSLNERQIKKMIILFDIPLPFENFQFLDKKKTFSNYITLEFRLIKNLIELKEQSNFESELNRILNDRLTLLSNLNLF